MKKITVYCGESIQEKCGRQIHPVQEFELAMIYLNTNKDEVCYSNSSDFVSAIKYVGEKKGIETEFFLNGVSYGNSIDEIFADFNRALDLLDKHARKD